MADREAEGRSSSHLKVEGTAAAELRRCAKASAGREVPGPKGPKCLVLAEMLIPAGCAYTSTGPQCLGLAELIKTLR